MQGMYNKKPSPEVGFQTREGYPKRGGLEDSGEAREDKPAAIAGDDGDITGHEMCQGFGKNGG